jgi:hypothetical protein
MIIGAIEFADILRSLLERMGGNDKIIHKREF